MFLFIGSRPALGRRRAMSPYSLTKDPSGGTDLGPVPQNAVISVGFSMGTPSGGSASSSSLQISRDNGVTWVSIYTLSNSGPDGCGYYTGTGITLEGIIYLTNRGVFFNGSFYATRIIGGNCKFRVSGSGSVSAIRIPQ